MSSSSPVPQSLLEASFPTEVLEVLRRLQQAGYAAYVVGGSIRDLLLGLPAKDYDVATSCRAEAVVQLFRRVIPTGIQHGTVTVLIRSLAIEVTTFRGEGAYKDGRRPESVVFLDDVVEDLARRDFTVNAMAYDPNTRAFVDPFGGASDLAARRIRCVRDPRERFAEDGLRPLRAVRFASVLGFEIDPPTLQAIPETFATFDKVARERVREELSKLLLGSGPSRGLALLRQTGLLARILPELEGLASGDRPERFALALARTDATPRDLELRLAAALFEVEPAVPLELGLRLRPGPVARALERLRFPRKTIDTVARLVAFRELGLRDYADDAALRRALSAAGRELLEPLLLLARAQAVAGGDPEAVRRAEALATRVRDLLAARPPLTPAELALDGAQIMRILGEPQGPRVGQAARFLLEQVLDDPARNDAPRLEALLRSWAAPPK